MGNQQSVAIPERSQGLTFEDGNPPLDVKVRMYEDKVRRVTGDPFWTWDARRSTTVGFENERERAQYQEFQRSRGRYGSEKTGVGAGLPSFMQNDDIPREQREASQKMGERFREAVADFKDTARDAVQKTGRQWENESKEIGDDTKRLLKTRTSDNAEKYGIGVDSPAQQGYQDRHDGRDAIPSGARAVSDRLQESLNRTREEGQRKVDQGRDVGKDAARRAEDEGKSWIGWTKGKVEEVDRSIEHGLETAKDNTKNALGEVAHKTEDVYDRVIGRAREKADDVKYDVNRARDDVSEPREKTREAADKTKDAAGSWLGWGKNKVREGEERVKEGYEETKDAAERKYDQARDRVRGRVDEVKRDTEEPREKTREAGEKTKEAANSWIGWGKNKANEGEERAKDSYERTKDDVSRKFDRTKDDVSRSYDRTKDDVSRGVDRTKDDVSRGTDSLSRTLEDTKRAAERGWRETKDDVRQTYEQAKEKTERAFGRAGDKVEEETDRARGAVRGAKEDTRREYVEKKEETKGWFSWLGGDKKEERLEPESRAKFDAAERDLKDGYEKLKRGVSEETDAVSTRAGEYARAAKDATKRGAERVGETVQRGSDKGAESIAKGVRDADSAARQTERNFERATGTYDRKAGA